MYIRDEQFMRSVESYHKQVQIEKKGKKSREEIFYQMKVFLLRSVVGSVFL